MHFKEFVFVLQLLTGQGNSGCFGHSNYWPTELRVFLEQIQEQIQIICRLKKVMTNSHSPLMLWSLTLTQEWQWQEQFWPVNDVKDLNQWTPKHLSSCCLLHRHCLTEPVYCGRAQEKQEQLWISWCPYFLKVNEVQWIYNAVQWNSISSNEIKSNSMKSSKVKWNQMKSN